MYDDFNIISRGAETSSKNSSQPFGVRRHVEGHKRVSRSTNYRNQVGRDRGRAGKVSAGRRGSGRKAFAEKEAVSPPHSHHSSGLKSFQLPSLFFPTFLLF